MTDTFIVIYFLTLVYFIINVVKLQLQEKTLTKSNLPNFFHIITFLRIRGLFKYLQGALNCLI